MQATEPSLPTTKNPFSRDPRLRYVVPAIVLIVTAAVYLPTLSFGFVFDDTEQIVASQPHYTWSALPSYFTTDMWSYTAFVKSNYYRPGFLVWLLVNSRLFGLDSALWHASAILLHMAATLLFYFLARRVTGDLLVSGAAALLFGLHPAHVEVVAWLSGATESLFAALAIAALLFQLQGRRVAAWCFFAAAMFSKETSIVLPVLMAACDWLFPANPAASSKQRARSAAVTLGGCGAIFLVYLALRIHTLGAFAPILYTWTPRMLAGTIPRAALFYLRQLVLPLQYSVMYSLPITEFAWRQPLAPIVLVAAALVLVLLACRSRVYGFGMLLLVAPILPVLNLSAFRYDDFVHDRYLYLPSAGLCLLAAVAGARFFRPAVVAGVLLTGACVLMAYVNVQSSSVWTDNLTLFTYARSFAPDSDTLAESLGAEYLKNDRYGDALPLLRQVLLDETHVSLYENIALCYLGMEDPDNAIAFLQQAMTLYPTADGPHYIMARVYMHLSKWPEAEAEARESIRLQPQASPVLAKYHGRLAEILENEHNYAAALAEYQTQLRQNPASDSARDNVQRLEDRMKSAPTP